MFDILVSRFRSEQKTGKRDHTKNRTTSYLLTVKLYDLSEFINQFLAMGILFVHVTFLMSI